jgi:hypothetical protein
MKKILGLMVFVLALNGCDDGDLIQEDIDFESITTTQSCSDNNLIYKLKDQEAFILDIPSTTFTDEDSDVITTELSIDGSTNRVIYRFYNGTVATDNICETIPPISPNVVDQWTATSGTIQIVKSAAKTVDETTNSSRITAYNHAIVLKNVTFSKSKGGTQVYDTFTFGTYQTTATTLPFLFDETKNLNQCTSSNDLYKFTTAEAMIFTIDPTLLVNEVTTAGAPRTALIGTTTNKLTYRLFDDLLTSAYFCNATTPTTPTLNQEWLANAGTADASGTKLTGIVEVTTTTSGPNTFKHTIVLKKATLTRGNYNFSLGDSYTYGVLFTTN